MNEAAAPPVTPADFRATLGLFLSGVTVVAARDPASGEPHGMTASAFISVSLAPPLVLVSVDKKAHAHRILAAAGHYGVSFLAEGNDQLAMHYAGRPGADTAGRFVEQGGQPILEGALAWLACRIVDAHDAGDHTLYIGEVQALGRADGAHKPLGYFAGKFRTLAGG